MTLGWMSRWSFESRSLTHYDVSCSCKSIKLCKSCGISLHGICMSPGTLQCKGLKNRAKSWIFATLHRC